MMNHVKSYLQAFYSLLSNNIAGIHAESYLIDNTGGHASVNFRIKHLGYRFGDANRTGRFDPISRYV